MAPAFRLPAMADPRVLPGELEILVVAAEAAVGAATVGDFDGLVFCIGNGDGCAQARTGLFRVGIGYSVQRSNATPPEVAVERHPTPQLASDGSAEIVTKVPF